MNHSYFTNSRISFSGERSKRLVNRGRLIAIEKLLRDAADHILMKVKHDPVFNNKTLDEVEIGSLELVSQTLNDGPNTEYQLFLGIEVTADE